MHDDKWITRDKRTKKLVIRFRVKGYQRQFFIASGLPDSKRNRDVLRLRRDAIETDILLDRFDESLESYQFKKKTKVQKTPKVEQDISLIEVWRRFSIYQETQIEQTTILGRYENIKRFILSLPTTKISESLKIRDYIVHKYSKTTAWIYLNYFSQACDWAVKNGILKNNPFANLKIQKPKPINNQASFTIEQRDLIIEAFEEANSHYTNLIKLMFYTGCRPGEAFALTWDDISVDCRQISINKSCNFKSISKGTKNKKNRVFPVAENSRLHQLLLSMTRGSGLVFKNKQQGKITTETLRGEWKGKTTHGRYQLGIVGKLANDGIVPYMRIYSTRHTFATCAIASGVKPILVAKWLGDNLATVLKYYTHPDGLDGDCPDF